MRRRVRLTESDLHRIVKESVSRILNEVNVFDPRTGEYVSVHGNDQYDWDKMAGIRKYYKRQASDDVNRYYTDWCDLDDKIERGKYNGMSQTQLDNLHQQKKSARTNCKNMENIADRHEKAEDRNYANYYQMARQELKKLKNRIVSESVNMILSESDDRFVKWYRGFNSKYGSDKTHLIWLTDIEEARTYGNRVEEVILDKSKINPIDIDDLYYDYLVPHFGYKDVDYYEDAGCWYPENGLYPEEAELLLRNGYNCYYFITNDAECICLWDRSVIVSRRELSREEFNEIETYGNNVLRDYEEDY